MRQSYEAAMGSLDESQRAAATIRENAVIAAGAGSGKTRVLAARFLHLVIEREIPVEKILTLTFTRKAAAEMYGRIYASLRGVDHPLAEEAVRRFHLARISTIDAFCGTIARDACAKYGIAPDFSVDEDRAAEIAAELALPFFIERRKSAAIKRLMKKNSIAKLPERLFAQTAMRHATISSPPNFSEWLESQEREVRPLLDATARGIAEAAARLAAVSDGKGATEQAIAAAVDEFPEPPKYGDPDETFAAFISKCDRLSKIRKPGNVTKPNLVELKEIFASFKDELYPRFLSFANYSLNRPVIEETFGLLREYMELFNERKRAEGILSFADVSKLALDALISDADLRTAHKKGVDAIMIDEFQDDNAMQRDLLFLLAERPERTDPSVPKPEELCPDKLFFVGDEKQSIYRFRGADVSVFRSLAEDLSPKGERAAPELGTNYRTESDLLDAFNGIFPRVFLDDAAEGAKVPLFEATFAPIKGSRKTDGISPSLDVILVDKERFKSPMAKFSAAEAEARAVASEIARLISSGFVIRDGDATRPCKSGDFAILLRSTARQQLYERFLREEGIPSQSETLLGLFSDAPINDIRAMLRLAVYPNDDHAYAIALRSPFVGVGDIAFAEALLGRQKDRESGTAIRPPFDESLGETVSKSDAAAIARGRRILEKLSSMADRVPATELITELWYREGYRYALLRDPSLHRYLELYDYFFELARKSDARGETLAAFLDGVQSIAVSGEKIEGLDIPAERSGGVRIMTVHKSKGLEFPIVFIADAGNVGKNERNDEPLYFADGAGLSVNTGASDAAPSASRNWFYERGRQEEKAKKLAELRRLLYVAMTRAEIRLFVTGSFAGSENFPEGERSEQELRDLLAERLGSGDYSDDDSPDAKGRSFLDLLLPALSGAKIPGVEISEVVPESLQNRRSEAAGKTALESIARMYVETPLAKYEPSPRARLSATGLSDETDFIETVFAKNAGRGTPGGEDELDRLLEKLQISPSDLGTYAHEAIEARFTGIPLRAPTELVETVAEMTERFLDSDLGAKALRADWRKNEYAFVTRFPVEGKDETVSGQMDLFFRQGDTAYVVDYKTDREEIPERHERQLAVYRKAAADLSGLPVETWLFYLRTGHAIRLTDEK